MHAVLLLNADEKPLQVVPWERAVVLMMEDKVRLVRQRADWVIRSASQEIPWPSIVALKTYVRFRGKIKFQRRNVFARDDWTCQYCGLRPLTPDGLPATERLTMDHVVPRSQSVDNRQVELPWSRGKFVGVTSWENILTACGPCNRTKADRTPSQAHMMPLYGWPKRPSPLSALRIIMRKTGLPDDWEEHLD